MRLWLAVAVLLIGVLLPCGTEHNVAKRQIRRGGQRGRTTAAPVVTTPEPEYEYEDEGEGEGEEVAPAPQVSYQRRPVVVPEDKPADEPAEDDAEPARSSKPGTSLRRPQQAPPKPTSSTPPPEDYDVIPKGEGSPDYELPDPVRLPPGQRKPKTTTKRPPKPYVPDPNNENPDEGGYNIVVSTSGPPKTFSRRPSTRAATTTTTSAPVTARSPVRRTNSNRGSLPKPAGPPRPVPSAAGAPPPPDDIIAKILGGQAPAGGPAPSKPAGRPARPAAPVTSAPKPTTAVPDDAPAPVRPRQGGRRGGSRGATATTVKPTTVAEEDEEVPAPTPPPTRRGPARPGGNRRNRPTNPPRKRPTTAAPEDDEEEIVDKPTTPIPKRKPIGRSRFAIKPPKPVVVLDQPDDQEDEYEEQSEPREVTERAPYRPPSTTTTTTTVRPVVRYGNASRQAAASNEKKKFRGRFRPKERDEEDEDEEDGGYQERRYRPRSRGRGRGGSSRYREDDYDDDDEDYDDPPPRRNRNRGRDKDINSGRRGGNRGNRGRGPTTSPRPSTRIPPANLEKRKDGRVIDYLGDPNLPRELTGFSLVDYPFYITVPEDIVFDCNSKLDGFYASVPHFCQVFHYCHAGNRYSFLCPNYTLYDQTTFTCRFANTVNCPKSADHFNRNEALYKDKSTEAPITTQLIPDDKPAKKPKSKE